MSKRKRLNDEPLVLDFNRDLGQREAMGFAPPGSETSAEPRGGKLFEIQLRTHADIAKALIEPGFAIIHGKNSAETIAPAVLADHFAGSRLVSDTSDNKTAGAILEASLPASDPAVLPADSVPPSAAVSAPAVSKKHGIRKVWRCVNPRQAHSETEQAVYSLLWRKGEKTDNDRIRHTRMSQEDILRHMPTGHRLAHTRLVQQLLERLQEKLSIELIAEVQRTPGQLAAPRMYRIYRYDEMQKRREEAGFIFLARRSRGVTLLTADQAAKETQNDAVNDSVNEADLNQDTDSKTRENPDPVFSTEPSTPKVKKAPTVLTPNAPPVLTFSSLFVASNTSYTTAAALSTAREGARAKLLLLLAKKIAEFFGPVSDAALHTAIDAVFAAVPDATEDEFEYFADWKIHSLRRSRSVSNPVGLLLSELPKLFASASLQAYREKRDADKIRQQKAEEENQAYWRKVLSDPASTADEIAVAQRFLKTDS